MHPFFEVFMKKGIIAIVTVNMIWGFEAIGIEYLMQYMEPFVYTIIKLAVSLAILIPLVFIKEKRFHIDKADWPRVILCGIIGMCLYFNAENIGTELTSAAFATLVMTTVPVFGLVFDRLWFGGRITRMKFICVAGSIVGVFLLIAGEPMGVSLPGFFVMLFGSLLWSLYIALVKPVEEKYSLVTLLTGMMIPGFILQIILTFASHPQWSGMSAGNVLLAVLLGIVGVVIAELLYVFAIGRLTVTMTSIFENVFPLTSVVFSFIIFGTSLTAVQLIGGAVILVSVTTLALKE